MEERFFPRTIKTFLLEGKPTGVKTIELSGWTGKGFVIPRSNLSSILNRDDLKSPGVYFLVGENEEGEQAVYIGESENFIDRIQYHHRDKNKDFWNTVICFVSKDETLNKAYVKYLESIFYNDAKQAGRVKVESGKDSGPARLSESDLADADDFAIKIRMLLPSIGFSFLKQSDEGAKEEGIWYCKGKGADARGFPSAEGFTILAGSKIAKEETPTIPRGVKRARPRGDATPPFREIEDHYLIENNLTFPSPSFAAGFVLGRSANGWTEWKNADGKTLY